MTSLRRLQTRLFLSLFAAIALAIAAGAATMALTATEPTNRPAQVVARTVAARLERDWDDPAACDAYVDEMRKLTGLPARLRRDVATMPAAVERARVRGSALGFDVKEGVFVPVVRSGVVVGALQLEVGGPRHPWWRLAAGLLAIVVVLGLVARRVSRKLALPLEQVAHAAERFGAGDLAARTRLTRPPQRWVAEEVSGVALAFDTMADRIAAIVRDQRELLAAISHELRSPLGRARVALEIARERGPRDALPSQLDVIERELGAVDAILGDLLAVTRAGLSDLRKETVELGSWLRGCIDAEPAVPEVHLAVQGPVRAPVDVALLGRAVHNLLENARQYGHPTDRPLEARLEADPPVARIVVRDLGAGFPTDLVDRAFEPFVRGDAARTPSRSGSGLGLALVRRIAEAHGGRAFARNIVDAGAVRGAEVGVEIPLPAR